MKNFLLLLLVFCTGRYQTYAQCNYDASGLDNVACNNNATPSNPSDDYITFSLNPTGTNLDSGYEFDDVPGFPLPTQLDGSPALNIPYGVATTFRTGNGTAAGTGGVYEIIILDDSGNCNLPETIDAPGTCSNAAPCDILSVNFLGNPGPCNDNGTPNDPNDDFFTQNLEANFINRPSTGNLQIVPGGDQIGVYSIPVVQINGNSHIFNSVKFKADGTPTVITMNFTDDPACSETKAGPTIQSCSSGGGPCDITSVSFQNIGPCDDNGTSDPSDDFFTANVVVNFVNPPPTGNLQIEPGGDAIGTYSLPVANLVGNSHTFTGVMLKADGTQTVIEVHFTIPANQCTQTQIGPTVQACSFTPPVLTCPAAVTVPCANQVPAVNPASVTETHDCPGIVTITHLSDGISGQTCVNRLTITRTYQGSDQCAHVVMCTQTITVNDQTPPSLSCPVDQTVSCASLVPAANTTLVTGVSDNCGGALPTVSFINDVISNQTCANRFSVTRRYRATDACGNSASCSQIITVNDQTPPVFTFLPANVTVDCYLVPVVGIATASDNCTSGATVTFLGEISVPGICPVFKILTRTWRATDVCGNSATASQIITVTDFNAPQFLVLPQNQIVECGPNNAAEFQAFLDDRGGSVVQDCAEISYSHEDSPFQSN